MEAFLVQSLGKNSLKKTRTLLKTLKFEGSSPPAKILHQQATGHENKLSLKASRVLCVTYELTSVCNAFQLWYFPTVSDASQSGQC